MSLSRIAVRRLTKLADYMETVPRNKFSMAYWFQHARAGTHTHRFGRTLSAKDMNHCGTKACAVGWAATMPEFQRLGLRIAPKEAGIAPFSKAKKVFDLTTAQAHYLFGYTDEYGNVSVFTPKQWAKRARTFIRDNA